MIQPHGLIAQFVALYEEQLDATHDEVRTWLTNGLGAFPSPQEWVSQAEGEWGLVQSHRPYLLGELHRLRVAITKRYANRTPSQQHSGRTVLRPDRRRLLRDECRACRDTQRQRPEGSRGAVEHRIGPHSVDSGAPPPLRTSGPRILCSGRVAGRHPFSTFCFGVLPAALRPEPGQAARRLRHRGGVLPPAFPRESTKLMYTWLEEEFTQYSYEVKSEPARTPSGSSRSSPARRSSSKTRWSGRARAPLSSGVWLPATATNSGPADSIRSTPPALAFVGSRNVPGHWTR